MSPRLPLRLSPCCQAFLYYLETAPAGGPAAVSRRSGPGAAAAGPAAAAAQRARAQQECERREAARRAELAAQRQRELAEAEEVLAAFEWGGVARSRVRRIERVQQLDLWSQYQRRLVSGWREKQQIGRCCVRREVRCAWRLGLVSLAFGAKVGCMPSRARVRSPVRNCRDARPLSGCAGSHCKGSGAGAGERAPPVPWSGPGKTGGGQGEGKGRP